MYEDGEMLSFSDGSLGRVTVKHIIILWDNYFFILSHVPHVANSLAANAHSSSTKPLNQSQDAAVMIFLDQIL